jgi:pyruvate dehydrogenase E2 component (dihydrolipoamide acetyltransferase)
VSVASPSTRKLARETGVDAAALAAELGQDRISEADVRRKAGGGGLSPSGLEYWDIDHAAYGPGEWGELSRFDRLAAANLTAAQHHIPAVTHHDRADMGAVESFRQSLKTEANARRVRLTELVFHIKALARALHAFPRFNSSLSTDGATLFLKRYVHIGIAVDTPHGLVVPVIRDADRKGLWAIASSIADLAERAHARKVRREEMGGASMSVSNLGAIGGRGFSPMVNPPEVAILGIMRTSIEPIWDGEQFMPTVICPIDLTYDHRVINGADAARFLSYYCGLLADPRRLLL